MLFFCGTLFPALGFLNVYPFRFSFVADHFQYLASLGVIVLASAGVAILGDRWRTPANVRVAGLLAVTMVLGVLTWRQSSQYVDAETLYRATLKQNPTCWLAMNNLGDLQLRRGDGNLAEAVGLFTNALRLKPDYAEAHNNLGVAFDRMGRTERGRDRVSGRHAAEPEAGRRRGAEQPGDAPAEDRSGGRSGGVHPAGDRAFARLCRRALESGQRARAAATAERGDRRVPRRPCGLPRAGPRPATTWDRASPNAAGTTRRSRSSRRPCA